MSRLLRRGLLLVMLASLECLYGCAAYLAPDVPKKFMQPFEVAYKSKLSDNPSKAPLPNITEALSSMNDDMLGELEKENHISWYAGDVTLLGVVAAVAGAGTSAIGLRNSGAGVAAAGSTATSHYQVEPTFQAYLTGIKRISCVQSAVANIPTDIDHTVELLQSTAQSQDDIAAFISAYNTMQQNVYASVNVIRTSLTTSVFASRPTDVSTADFNSTLQKFKSATVNDPEKKTVDTVAGLMVAKMKADAQTTVDDATRDLATARGDERQAVLEAAAENANLQELDRGVNRFATAMRGEMSVEATTDARKTELTAQFGGIAAQRAKQQLLVNAKTEQQASATKRVTLAQERLDAAVKAQARVANANTATQAQQATVAIEQVKGLAAALTLCNAL